MQDVLATTRACALYLSILNPLVAPWQMTDLTLAKTNSDVLDNEGAPGISFMMRGMQHVAFSTPTVRNGLSWKYVDLLRVPGFPPQHSDRYRSNSFCDQRQDKCFLSMHPKVTAC